MAYMVGVDRLESPISMNIVALDGKALEPNPDRWLPIQQAVPNADFQWWPNTQPGQVLDRSAEADILVINKVKLGDDAFSQLPRLKMVAVTATGYDNVALTSAKDHGVVVCNVPIYSTRSVAQHVFACLLQMIHRPFEHDQAIREGQWQQAGQFTFWISPLTELAGKTMGIVGFGRIGQATASLAKAFGMEVLISSRTERVVEGFEESSWVDVRTLFSQCDVVSLHCPQTKENFGFVDKELLSVMKPSAILINTARGGLINERELAHCLDCGILGGACLDVVSSEPIDAGNPLLTARNCLITPHVAWTTVESRTRLMQYVARNIRSFADGNPTNVLNP